MGRKKKCPIRKLPSEMISMVLLYTDIEDIIAFGATCKHFNNIIKNSTTLWKTKFKNIMPSDIYAVVEKDSNATSWFNQVKDFYSVKQKVYREVLSMSPRHFWQNNSITLQDVRRFFTIALGNNMNYYYTVFLLQELVTNGARKTGLWEGQLPYTMTEMHYSKVVLCHLMHSFLAVKWAQAYIQAELRPQVVLSYFLQWSDVTKLYMVDELDTLTDSLVREVEDILIPEVKKPATAGEIIGKRMAEKKLKGRDVVTAISQVLYHQRNITVTSVMNLNTLYIPEILKQKSGHVVAIATLYYSIAIRCGLTFHLVAFPDHFFLEWVCTDNGPKEQTFKIHLETGELRVSGRCPFASVPTNYKGTYCPNYLLRHIITTFTKHVEPGRLASNNWYRQNAFLLLELLNSESARGSPYYNYLRYLTNDVPLDSLSPINIKYIENEHLQIILRLTYLNAFVGVKGNKRGIKIKKRNNDVKYAVGMICLHKKYMYTGIIVGWDAICDADWGQHPEVKNLTFGSKQPFYHVLAADESNRYVPQENLVPETNPQRLFSLEEKIAPEFTHFNGFAYVPNKEKKVEYPEDAQISDMYLSRAESKFGVDLTNPTANS